MSTRPYTKDDYQKAFLEDPELTKRALERALDIRKFEIELYWKRAAYFWTFIAAAFGGFIAVHASMNPNKYDALVLISNLGVIFSFCLVVRQQREQALAGKLGAAR